MEVLPLVIILVIFVLIIYILVSRRLRSGRVSSSLFMFLWIYLTKFRRSLFRLPTLTLFTVAKVQCFPTRSVLYDQSLNIELAKWSQRRSRKTLPLWDKQIFTDLHSLFSLPIFFLNGWSRFSSSTKIPCLWWGCIEQATSAREKLMYTYCDTINTDRHYILGSFTTAGSKCVPFLVHLGSTCEFCWPSWQCCWLSSICSSGLFYWKRCMGSWYQMLLSLPATDYLTATMNVPVWRHWHL